MIKTMKRKAQYESPSSERLIKRPRCSLTRFSPRKKVTLKIQNNFSKAQEGALGKNRKVVLQIHRDPDKLKETVSKKNSTLTKNSALATNLGPSLKRPRGRPKKILTVCPEPTNPVRRLTKIKDKAAASDRDIPLKPLFVLLDKTEVADILKNLTAKRVGKNANRNISNPAGRDLLNYRGIRLKPLRVRIDKSEVESELKKEKPRRLLSDHKPAARTKGRPPGSKNKPRASLNVSNVSLDSQVSVERSKSKKASPKLKVKFSFQFNTKPRKPVDTFKACQSDSQIHAISYIEAAERLDVNDNQTSKKSIKDNPPNVHNASNIEDRSTKDVETTGSAFPEDEKRRKTSKDNSDDTDESEDSDDDSDDDSENIVKRREKNLEDNKRMLQQMMAEFGAHDLIKPASMKHLSPKPKPHVDSPGAKRGTGAWLMRNSNRKSPPRLRARPETDSNSKRNLSFNPRDKEDVDDDDDDGFKVFLDEEDRQAEGVKFERLSRRSRHASNRDILPVEEVTASMLSKVLSKSKSTRIYDQINGTSCHQCRQKTKDIKTCCRSDDCYGVRGQFCGVCLHNRYGEDAREALLDPNWICPPCRGICNCSICRNRVGRGATGFVTRHVRNLGYKSVHHLLAKKGGDGEEEEEEEEEEVTNDNTEKTANDGDECDGKWLQHDEGSGNKSEQKIDGDLSQQRAEDDEELTTDHGFEEKVKVDRGSEAKERESANEDGESAIREKESDSDDIVVKIVQKKLGFVEVEKEFVDNGKELVDKENESDDKEKKADDNKKKSEDSEKECNDKEEETIDNEGESGEKKREFVDKNEDQEKETLGKLEDINGKADGIGFETEKVVVRDGQIKPVIAEREAKIEGEVTTLLDKDNDMSKEFTEMEEPVEENGQQDEDASKELSAENEINSSIDEGKSGEEVDEQMNEGEEAEHEEKRLMWEMEVEGAITETDKCTMRSSAEERMRCEAAVVDDEPRSEELTLEEENLTDSNLNKYTNKNTGADDTAKDENLKMKECVTSEMDESDTSRVLGGKDCHESENVNTNGCEIM